MQRGFALILDQLIAASLFLLLTIPAILVLIGSGEWDEGPDGNIQLLGASSWSFGFFLLAVLLVVLFELWNLGVRQGRHGQSIGKQLIRIKVVRQDRSGPLGVFAGIGRMILHSVLGSIPVVNVLNFVWPWWDPQNQCWHDKLISSIVLKSL